MCMWKHATWSVYVKTCNLKCVCENMQPEVCMWKDATWSVYVRTCNLKCVCENMQPEVCMWKHATWSVYVKTCNLKCVCENMQPEVCMWKHATWRVYVKTCNLKCVCESMQVLNKHQTLTSAPTVTHCILARPLRCDNPSVRHRQGGCWHIGDRFHRTGRNPSHIHCLEIIIIPNYFVFIGYRRFTQNWIAYAHLSHSIIKNYVQWFICSFDNQYKI